MSYKNVIYPIPLESVNSANFVGVAYIAFAAAGLPNPCVILSFVNTSNVDVVISFDGVTDHIYLTQTVLPYRIDAQTNSQFSSHTANFRQGSLIYARAAAGAAGVGLVYLNGFYVKTGN